MSQDSALQPKDTNERRSSSYELPGGKSKIPEAINQWIGSTLLKTAKAIPAPETNQDSRFSQGAAQISKDLDRDPQLITLLAFLRADRQPNFETSGSRKSIVIDGHNYDFSSHSDEPNIRDFLSPTNPVEGRRVSECKSPDTIKKSKVKAKSYEDCYQKWGWTDATDPTIGKKRAIFECLVPSYSQAFYRPTFFLEFLTNSSGSVNITPQYAWDKNTIVMTFTGLPSNRHEALYTTEISISPNKLSMSLGGGYSLSLDSTTTHKSLFGLREFLANHMDLQWIDRYKDKFALAAGFLAMSITASAVLGSMTAQFGTIGIVLLALSIVVGVAGTATFSAMGGRAFHLLHGPLEKEEEFDAPDNYKFETPPRSPK